MKLLRASSGETPSFLRKWSLLLGLIPSCLAINFSPVPSQNLDISPLGRVGIVGDFDAISLYSFQNQNENPFNTNGSQAVLTQLPNGAFAQLAAADAYITSLCSFVLKDGTLAGVIVGGNFTSLGGLDTQGIAMINPTNGSITPLPGLSGKVNALYCDQPSSTVYVGGDFRGGNSSNAIAWVGTTGWANLPFAGFNGPVKTISKEANGNIVFGGSFDGLGNASSPNKLDQQVINIQHANISAGSTTVTAGFNDPNNIVCKTGQDGAGNAWLLSDNEPGYWRADFLYGFRPTKLRVWNTHQDGRGTKTFRFTAAPINGIMNFTYTDPASKQNATCDARCPLSNDPSVTFQDFQFVNSIGMQGFQIDISEWYGAGGGLAGIELFEDDIYAFAVNDFNEPTCAGIQFPSNAIPSGPWENAGKRQSDSEYLTATASTDNPSSVSVVFKPDIKQSGNYTVTMYTPGCIQDGTCAQRGIVNVTGNFASGTRQPAPVQTTLFQTNNFDKYDQIYNGYVDATSGSFQPSVTLTLASGQSGSLDIVAQKVRFEMISGSGGLNGLYEYNPSQVSPDTNYANNAIDSAGIALDAGAVVSSVMVKDTVIYVGGNFTAQGENNIFSINNGKATGLPGGGVNGAVMSMFLNGSLLYVGGNFTDTVTSHTDGISGVAAYSTSDNKWQALGAGVNGRVCSVIPLALTLTSSKPETVITFSGDFDHILPFGSFPAVPVEGFATWVPSQNNWLSNLDISSVAISGRLSASVDVPGKGSLFGGALASQSLGASGGVGLTTDGQLSLRSLGLKLQAPNPQSSSKRKRATQISSSTAVTGVVTGFFYENGGRNVTILGGHFAGKASNGATINNLAFINGSNSNQVTGINGQLDANSSFLALDVQGDTLYAGGQVSGNVNNANINGLILYDLRAASLVPTQPPALSGIAVQVNAISTMPNSGDVYVGGSFDSAGSLSCPSVCIYTTATAQWDRPGTGISGSVAALSWTGPQQLLAGGNLTVNGSATRLAKYDRAAQAWSPFPGAAGLPGPVTAMSPANPDGSQQFVAGASTNGSAFLMKYNGSSWISIGDTLGPTTRIRGIQTLSLSKNHASNNIVPQDQTLLVTGQLNLPNFGNASAALFDGSTFTPFILSTSSDQPGSLSQLFSQNQNFFAHGHKNLALGFVILIALAISLALIFLLVVIGILANYLRRRKEGYIPAPTNNFDIRQRVPPQALLESLGQQGRNGSNAPRI